MLAASNFISKRKLRTHGVHDQFSVTAIRIVPLGSYLTNKEQPSSCIARIFATKHACSKLLSAPVTSHPERVAYITNYISTNFIFMS